MCKVLYLNSLYVGVNEKNSNISILLVLSEIFVLFVKVKYNKFEGKTLHICVILLEVLVYSFLIFCDI